MSQSGYRPLIATSFLKTGPRTRMNKAKQGLFSEPMLTFSNMLFKVQIWLSFPSQMYQLLPRPCLPTLSSKHLTTSHSSIPQPRQPCQTSLQLESSLVTASRTFSKQCHKGSSTRYCSWSAQFGASATAQSGRALVSCVSKCGKGTV